MPNENDHIAQANKNDEALQHLMASRARFPEWVTTIAFYKAVHIVEALLFNQHKRNSHDHTTRLRTLQNLYPSLYKHFRVLYAASMIARYLCDNTGNGATKQYSTFSDFMPPGDVIPRIVRGRLVPIEQIALGLLSDGAKKHLTQTHIASAS